MSELKQEQQESTQESENQENNLTANDTPEYDEVEIFGIPALFANERIAPEELPEGLFRYDLRGSDDDPGYPVAVENVVRVNHAGTLVTAQALAIPETGFLPLAEEEGLDFIGGSCSIQEFQRMQKKDSEALTVESIPCHKQRASRNAGKDHHSGKTAGNRTAPER